MFHLDRTTTAILCWLGLLTLAPLAVAALLALAEACRRRRLRERKDEYYRWLGSTADAGRAEDPTERADQIAETDHPGD